MTRATKRAAKVRDIPRRNAANALQDVRYADQGPRNVTLFLSSPEQFESSPDNGDMHVSKRTVAIESTHGLTETMIERLLKHNDVVLLMECDQRMRRVPYRGKQRRSDVLRFLRIVGPQARALVYSHQADDGPVWIDVMSGEVTAR
jgi:hypothetical protein